MLKTTLWSAQEPTDHGRPNSCVKGDPRDRFGFGRLDSYWEVIKAQKGMLTIADPVNWWSRATDMLGGDILSIRMAHISVFAGLPDIHKDPFDRMLIAQASAEGLALIPCDEHFSRHPVRVLW
jgi:PIN domain nuclease of toxin-antitoxin system